jgi:hypothetical protein
MSNVTESSAFEPLYPAYSNLTMICAIILLFRSEMDGQKKFPVFYSIENPYVNVAHMLGVYIYFSISNGHRIHLAGLVQIQYNNRIISAIYNKKTYPMFEIVKGCLHFGASQSVRISTTFLLVDRIEAILFFHMSNLRICTHYVSIGVIVSQFFGNFFMLYYRAITFPDQSASKYRVNFLSQFSCREIRSELFVLSRMLSVPL